jgi:hypothetical protein
MEEGPPPQVFMLKLINQQMGYTMTSHRPCQDLGITRASQIFMNIFNLFLKLWLSFGDLIIVVVNLI